MPDAPNQLFFGDNLEVLREEIADESVDLIYLDPPFNSKANYNVLFKSPTGDGSVAQVQAFEDTWHWGPQAEQEFNEILAQPNTDTAEMMQSLRGFLGENDMMAYLTMMANRLLEMHKVLKGTGSLYLHCDPTAGHYIKIVMDSVFGPKQFRNEIIWRRTGSHNKAQRWAPLHDILYYYTKSKTFTWNSPRQLYMMGHVQENFVQLPDGRYRTNYYGNVLTGSGTRNGESGKTWKGFNPTAKGRHWAIPGAIWDEVGVDPKGMTQHEKLDLLHDKGFIKITPGQAWPIYERMITPADGPASSDLWAFQPYTEGTVFDTDRGIDSDVSWLKPKDLERLGYPTQKPQGLLERLITASSDKGDVILDPFCGCGTAVHVAEKLNRKWIGIDITHLAIALIENRLNDAFPGITYEVHGTPKDLGGAKKLADLDKYEFQYWACSLVNAQPYKDKKKGADGGVDGLIFFKDDKGQAKKIVVSVKGGKNVGVDMIKNLITTVSQQKAEIGLFVTLTKPTKPMVNDAVKEGYYTAPTGKSFPKIQILTIQELLEETKAPSYPSLDAGGLTFKKAKQEEQKQEQHSLL